MPDVSLSLALQTLCAIAAAGAVLLVVRDVRRRDPVLGTILSAGLLIRAGAGAALFWISYLDLPVLASLHSGDGFWELAPDARTYYRTASDAVAAGWDQIRSSSPSPTYTRSLALWMWLVGVSPASGLLLNLVLYVASSWLVAAVFSGSMGARLLLGAYSFAPAAVLFSVQPLKDQFVIAAMLFVAAGMWWWTTTAGAPNGERPRRLGGAALVIAGVFLIAGVRAYLAVFIVFAFVVTSLIVVFRARHRWRTGLSSGALALVLWIAFAAGSGPYYALYGKLLERTIGHGLPGLSAPFSTLDAARQNFARSGGDTNIAEDEGSWDDPVGSAGVRSRFARFILGAAIMLVPIHLVQWGADLSLRGGRGLLFVTDIDTIVVVLFAVAGVVRVARSWNTIAGPARPFVVFCVTLACTTGAAMAYVVTNFGTLFRLRLMPFLVLWLLPLALWGRAASNPHGDDAEERSERQVPAA